MKGMVEVVEVVIGMLIVFSIFIAMYNERVETNVKSVETKIKLLNFLKTMDEEGRLANLVLTNNTKELTKEFQNILKTANISVLIGEGQSQLPKDEVYSIVYFVPGNHTIFRPTKLTVYVWF